MNKSTVPISDVINKPVLDLLKMKLEAFKRMDENNRIRKDEAYRDKFPRIGDSVFRTVEKILTLFRKKFEQGQVKANKLKFTYSYFKKHANSRYCERTFLNHLNTLCGAFQKIFKLRERDTLGIPGKDCVCVCIEFAPGIMQFKNAAYNEIYAGDFKVKVKYANVSPNEKSGTTMPYLNKDLFAPPSERTGGAKSIGSLLGGLFKG